MNPVFIITAIFIMLNPVFVAVAQTKSAPVTGTEVGNLAPEIISTDINGKTLKLSSFRGYIVLVDFWASWCAPCRKENPNLVKAYNTYSKLKLKNAKGFVIFSVSLDYDKDMWKKAIEDDKLSWKTHVSELKRWACQAAKDYNVNSIPMNFLLNSKGIIIAKNLRGDNLLMELEKLVQY